MDIPVNSRKRRRSLTTAIQELEGIDDALGISEAEVTISSSYIIMLTDFISTIRMTLRVHLTG